MRHGCQQCRLQARCKSKDTFRRQIFNLHLLKGGSGVIVSVYLLNVNLKKKNLFSNLLYKIMNYFSLVPILTLLQK